MSSPYYLLVTDRHLIQKFSLPMCIWYCSFARLVMVFIHSSIIKTIGVFLISWKCPSENFQKLQSHVRCFNTIHAMDRPQKSRPKIYRKIPVYPTKTWYRTDICTIWENALHTSRVLYTNRIGIHAENPALPAFPD